MDSEKNEQLDFLFDQQIYLFEQELQKLKKEKNTLIKEIADNFANKDNAYEPIISSYSNAITKLQLKELELKEIQQKCDTEQSAHEIKLKKLRETISTLESDILN